MFHSFTVSPHFWNSRLSKPNTFLELRLCIAAWCGNRYKFLYGMCSGRKEQLAITSWDPACLAPEESRAASQGMLRGVVLM